MSYFKERGASPRLCVLMGGAEGERDVSLQSGRTVVRHLAPRYRVTPVELVADGSWRVPTGTVGEELDVDGRWFDNVEPVMAHDAIRRLTSEPVMVFNALHGPLGEDGTIQGFLQLHGIPFTGPETTAAAVTMDKRLTKEVLRAAGIRTPRSFTVPAARLLGDRLQRRAWSDLAAEFDASVPFPWVMKPNRLGSSVGVTWLKNAAELVESAGAALAAWPDAAHREDVLFETAIAGRELSCAVLDDGDEDRALPPIEIRPRRSHFFDYASKYTAGATDEICPAPISAPERRRVEDVARCVHRLFRCSPLSRTDLFLTPDGELEVLEVNTLPGLTETSLVPLAARRAGIDLGDLLASVVEAGWKRAAPVPGVVGTGPGSFARR